MGAMHALGLPWDPAAFVLLLPRENTAGRQSDLRRGTRSGPRKGVGKGGLRRGLHHPGMTVHVPWLGQVRSSPGGDGHQGLAVGFRGEWGGGGWRREGRLVPEGPWRRERASAVLPGAPGTLERGNDRLGSVNQ